MSGGNSMKNFNKKLLSFAIVLCMFLSCFSGVVFAKDTETIVILYENDVHCAVEGYSKLAAMKMNYQKIMNM